MFKEYLQTYKIGIVIIGQFNPALVQPFWLAQKKLIRDGEAENAKVGVVHNEISRMDLDWVSFEVTPQKFEIRTSQEPFFGPVKDLVMEIFKVLKETPIYGFGINHLQYFDLRDQDRHYNFGNRLSPLSNWNEYLNDPRLSVLNITERNRKDGLRGEFNIRIQEPDLKIPSRFGVLININDHIECDTNTFLKMFSENWDASFKRAEEVCENIWHKVNL